MSHHKHNRDEKERSDCACGDSCACGQGGAGGDAPAAPELDAIRSERDDLLGRLQRVSADYVNYQKRVQRDIEQAREFSNESLMKSLLPVLDDMERALEAARANHSPDDPLLAGMKLVHDKLLGVLGGFGLTRVGAQVGQPFDHEIHQAIMQQPSDEHPPRTILAVLASGYQLKGRTIRAASVAVSAEPQDAQTNDQE